jgi:hypothetical protein
MTLGREGIDGLPYVGERGETSSSLSEKRAYTHNGAGVVIYGLDSVSENVSFFLTMIFTQPNREFTSTITASKDARGGARHLER